MNGAEALVEMLVRYDTRVVFGLPGDTSIGLYDALCSHAGQITHVLARDERGASFMADAYARLTGKPGICEGPSGGGATYLLPGVTEAHKSSIPLIALTTDNPLDYAAQGALTDLDQSQLYQSVTKWSALPKNADMLPHFVRRAFRLATSARPGAVHLTLAKDVLAQELGPGTAIFAEDGCKTYPSHRTRPAADAVSRAARRLVAAKRPVIVAGGGALASGAHEELLALAQFIGAPVATTINGKGSISENVPHSLGVIGGNGGRPYANQVVAQADLVLFVGSKVNYVDTDDWHVPPLAHPPTILQIDIDPGEIGNNYPIAEGLCGDAKLALADLLDALRDALPSPVERREWLDPIAALRVEWRNGLQQSASSQQRPIHPRRVIHELARVLPEESVIICDPGTPTPYLASEFELRRPGRSIVFPRAQGGLGYAIPGVVGARFAKPHQRIVGLCGDGSFAIAAGDLITAARVGGPVVLVLFNNRSYGWIKALQKQHSGARYLSVDLDEPVSYVRMAEAAGWRGVQVSDPDALAPALERAFGESAPFLVEVLTASESEVVPPVAPWQRWEENMNA